MEKTLNLNEKIDMDSAGHDASVFDKLLLVLELAVTLAFFIILPLRSTFLRHCLVTVGSIVFYIISIQRLIKQGNNILTLFATAFLSVNLFLALASNIYDFDYEMLYSSLNFIALVIIMSTENPSLINKNKKIVYYFAVLSTVTLFGLSRTSVAYTFETGVDNGFLALGMTNSNLTGMLLFAVVSVLILYLKKVKSIMFLLILAMFYLIYLTGSRSALISAIAILIYSLFYSNKRIPSIVIIIMTLLPIALMLLYVWLFNILDSDITFWGKPLFSGRQNIFLNIFYEERTFRHFLFGDIKNNYFAITQSPNGPLAIYLFSGIFGTVLFYTLSLKKLCRCNSTANSPFQRKSIIIILCVFLLSSSETFFFTGIFPGITFMYLISLMMDSNVVIKE